MEEGCVIRLGGEFNSHSLCVLGNHGVVSLGRSALIGRSAAPGDVWGWALSLFESKREFYNFDAGDYKSIAMKPAFTAALSEGEVFRRLLGKETDVRLFELPTGELKGRRESPFMMEVFYNSVFEGKFFPSNRVRSKPLQLI